MSTAVTGLERSRLAAALLRSPVERIVLLIWTVWDGIEGGFRRHQPKLTVQPWWWRFALGRFRCAKAPEAKARSRCQKREALKEYQVSKVRLQADFDGLPNETA